MVEPKYKRVVLKLSGEAMAGQSGFGIDPATIKEMVKEIKEVHALGVESPLLSVVAISGAGLQALRWAWNGRKLTIWAC